MWQHFKSDGVVWRFGLSVHECVWKQQSRHDGHVCLSPETVYPLENLPIEAQPQGIWDQGQAVAKHWQKSTSQPIKEIHTPKQPKGVFWKTQSQKMTTKRTHSCKTKQGCSRWLLRCFYWWLVCCYEIASVHWAVEKTHVVVFMIFWSMIQVLPSKSVQLFFSILKL